MTNRAGRLLTRIDRSGGGLTADLFLYALSAAFALLTARTSTLLPHRAWGAIAFWAYLAATLITLAQFMTRRRPRVALTWLTWLSACLLPLVVEAVQRAGGRTDRAQEEVLVVERMGDRLLHTGSPYLGRDAILALPADERLGAYSPYQPGMAVFGLPRAAFGDFWWTDARVWFAVVTAGALIIAVRLLPRSPLRVRAIQVATVFPICALTLATGGDDLPVLALCLLGLALVGVGSYGWAGVAIGAAGAMKPFAFPVIAVLVALAVARWLRPVPDPAKLDAPAADRQALADHPVPAGSIPEAGDSRTASAVPAPGDVPASDFPAGEGVAAGGGVAGRPAASPRWAWRLVAGAVGLPIVVLLPPALVGWDGFVENVLRFPLGHGVVESPAQSPFPGYLIAQHLPAGHYLATGLLVAVAAAFGVRLLRKPPRTATAAALLSGLGLLAAILLMPTTRFGYLLYPAAFLIWAPALRSHTAARAPQGDAALYRQ
ncbi:glycosyltransferase 87 family protein [Actinoplanes sp. NPDC051343]|uniref:glycosyltransferase 87 family protein n=1 Tax=Actinoplanes sp. NPDC051343 TaxID=3363906 RepID=UPI003791709F